jgi:hypothetical protein
MTRCWARERSRKRTAHSVAHPLAEHAGDDTEAAALYDEAAEPWQQFGNVPESPRYEGSRNRAHWPM